MLDIPALVRTALDNLAAAGGPEDVAAKLQAEGIRGRRSNAECCALVAYARHAVPETHRLGLAVQPDSDETRSVILVDFLGDLDVRLDLPAALSEFARRFDAGFHPELEEARTCRA